MHNYVSRHAWRNMHREISNTVGVSRVRGHSHTLAQLFLPCFQMLSSFGSLFWCGLTARFRTEGKFPTTGALKKRAMHEPIIIIFDGFWF